MRCSLIVTTYNRPDALVAVLHGLSAQTDRGFEILIADDGSTEDTAIQVARAIVSMDIPVRHLWQEDRGFRAGAVRNLAIDAARGEYLVFLDGDCVPRPGFVAAHRRLATRGWFVAGNRILLSQAFTARMLTRGTPFHAWSLAHWGGVRLVGGINRFLPLLDGFDGAWRNVSPQRWQGARTCNLAVWREDLITVNGFDERYTGWGHEDADLAIRLIRAGIQRRDGRFATAVLHLWHAENDRSHLGDNERRLAEILAAGTTRAVLGLDRSHACNGDNSPNHQHLAPHEGAAAS